MAKQTQAAQTPESIRKKLLERGYNEQGGEVTNWEAGMTVEGIYQGMTPPRSDDSSPVIRVVVDGQIERLWAPTILESKLADVQPGTEVIILCKGKTEEIKGGRWRGTLAWGFDVFTK